MGELHAQPATHHRHGQSAEEAAAADGRGALAGAELAIAPVPAGTVTFYRLDLRHRGGAHALPHERARGRRLIASLKLLGAQAFVPDGIPLKVLPEDAGRWWIGEEGVVDARASV